MRFLAVVVAILIGLGIHGLAQEQTEATDERARLLRQMRRLADRIQIHSTPDRTTEVSRLPEPVLRYADATRVLSDSTLWVWSDGGRPSAIVGLEFYGKRPAKSQWLCEVASVSSQRIAVTCGDELQWTAREPGAKFTRLAGVVGERPATRLIQMRDLQRRFTAHEQTPVEGRIELRPLAKPLHRYEDAAAGILDGAILSFANGTNPEVFLMLEAIREPKGDVVWQYALIQMTGAVVTVELDGQELWSRGEADPPAVRDAYVNRWLANATER
jgi:hypothetical protein